MRQIVEGLFQGDIGDLNSLKVEAVREKYKFALTINVGSTNWVPRGVPSIHLPMSDLVGDDDPERTKNDWQLILDVLLIALGVITRGGRVLVVCDAGISRSVVVSAMAVSILKDIPMMVDPPFAEPLGPVAWTGPERPELGEGRPLGVNYELVEMLRTPGELMPSLALWMDAARALETVRDEIRKLEGGA